MVTSDQRSFRQKVREKRICYTETTESDKQLFKDHYEQYQRRREPLLKVLASKVDVKLFRQAQAKACEDPVSYLNEIVMYCVTTILIL